MGALGEVILFPTAEHLPLLGPLALAMLLFFLPFAGLLLFSTLGSLLVRPRHPGVAHDLVHTGLGHGAALLVFGLLPLLTMIFLFAQMLAGAENAVAAYLERLLLIGAGALALLYGYRRTGRMELGALGLLALGGTVFHFLSTLTLLIYPEKWAQVRGPLPFVFSVQVIVQFAIFAALAIAFTGAMVLLVHFQWPERRPRTPEGERPLLRGIGLGGALAGPLLAAPAIVWSFYTAPRQALSPRAYGLGLLLLAALLVVALAALAMVRARRTHLAWPLFLAALAAFGLHLGGQRAFQTAAMKEHNLVLAAQARATREELVAQREAQYASSADLGLEAGERIYRERCTACHAFDRRVVGPAYRDVLPKYEGEFAALTDYIYSPQKIDPDYPPMPSQGLKRPEVRAVAAYLWKEFSGVDPTASAEAETPGAGAAETPAATPPAEGGQ